MLPLRQALPSSRRRLARIALLAGEAISGWMGTRSPRRSSALIRVRSPLVHALQPSWMACAGSLVLPCSLGMPAC